MKVTKHSGEVVEFDIEKLRLSLLKSGAEKDIVAAIVASVQKSLFDGITTKQIYTRAFEELKKHKRCDAARYNLRSGLEMLGPAGFYFEKYVSRLFDYLGYHTHGNLLLQGKSVTHEIDLVIQKKHQISIVECKFHSIRESTTDVKVPMYILSRFNDLKGNVYSIFSNSDYIDSCLIVTNTRFSEDAIIFSKYYGLELLSWDYPSGNGLKKKIDDSGLYPITCLTSLSIEEKEALMMRDIIVVNQLIGAKSILDVVGISPLRFNRIEGEVKGLCNLK
ncbi:ATP cone domain-containing protein [Flavobacterium sp.]|uniref:ATP cone domain-containing protein n=1 Tax=Flavobacterium sp. TaxID=239 RepID=UPI003D0C3442